MSAPADRAEARAHGSEALSSLVESLNMTLHAAAETRGERDRLMRRLNRSGTFTHAELAGQTGLSGAGVRAAISRAPDDPF